VIFVHFRQYGKFKKIQSRVIRELEKKLNKHVVIIAQRTILSKSVRLSPISHHPQSDNHPSSHSADPSRELSYAFSLPYRCIIIEWFPPHISSSTALDIVIIMQAIIHLNARVFVCDVM
jgi:hypothetical protein